jgi:hypothetical protein
VVSVDDDIMADGDAKPEIKEIAELGIIHDVDTATPIIRLLTLVSKYLEQVLIGVLNSADATTLEHHLVGGEGTSLICEHVLHLAKLFVDHGVQHPKWLRLRILGTSSASPIFLSNSIQVV